VSRGRILRSEDGERGSIGLACSFMDDALSLEVLRQDGRQRAAKAGAALLGLGQREGLALLATLRAGLNERRSAMYGAGFSAKEVQAWTNGYNEGLLDEMDEWLASLGRPTDTTYL
jgi:hypothetical protein